MAILEVDYNHTVCLKLNPRTMKFKDKLIWTWRLWFGYDFELRPKVEVIKK